MKLIASLNQHDLGLHDQDDTPIVRTRRAARAVMRNAQGQIAIMYFTKTGLYKLPGGGIDEDESIEEALHREVREETGYHIDNIQELGVVEEERFFCGMHQTSYCFTADAANFVGSDLTDKEAAEGMELRWLEGVEVAIGAIESVSQIDDDGSVVGFEMMKLRDVAILRAALNALD